MITKSKSRKIVLIFLIVLLAGVIALCTMQSLFANDNYIDSKDVNNVKSASKVVRLYSTRPFVVAESMDKAVAYAATLGMAKEDFDFMATSILNIDANGSWVGMNSTDLLKKMAHLLLPNNVKNIDVTKTDANKGVASVQWLSITADTGSQLASITAAGSTGGSAFNTAAWLERIDFSKATNLKSIPAYTFYACDRLYDVALPDSITSIGSQAIVSAALLHISLPAGLGVDGAGLDTNAFNGSKKLVEIELPSNASADFETKVKSMSAVWSTYLNVYKKGSGRSWMVCTNDGFVFCKNTERTSTLASGTNLATTSYVVGKWYLVGYRGPESGGDTINADNDFMVSLPKQIDLSREGVNRKDAFDYIDCSGTEVQNNFSDLTTSEQLGSNVAINSPVAGNDAEGKRVIAGESASGKLRYDIGQWAFYYRWVWHTTIPDGAVDVIGNSAFDTAPIWTFNLGDVNSIGQRGLAFLGRTTGLIFYFPSNNPNCAKDVLDYKFWSSDTATRLFIYRNHTDYNNRLNINTGLHKAVSDLSAGGGKYYSYLIDIIPNITELNTSDFTYENVVMTQAKMQRLYTGDLKNYSGGGIYSDGFRYLRDKADVWRHDAAADIPSLSEYTGYSSTAWYADVDFAIQYTATSIGTETASNINSLRNALSKGLDSINIYAKKITSFELKDKVRVYTDKAVTENSTEITDIPASVTGDYTVKVTKYVDSNNDEKAYDGVIQEAGIYTIQVRPNPKFGAWDETDIPTMTVTVSKATIDLSDASIFRMGVTSDGSDVLNLRPGKEIATEQQTSLYYYAEQGSWYTSEQVGIGELTRKKEGLWNSFVRAQNTSFRLALITPIIKDVHTGEEIFTCDFPTEMHDKSGEYLTQFKVQLTEREMNNYQFVAFNDEERQLTGYVNSSTGTVDIAKFWYIVQLNNWLTSQGNSGVDSPSYHMASEWEFGTETNSLFEKPTIALGLELNPEITFSLFLNSPNLPNDTTFSLLAKSIGDYDNIINTSLPVGDYRIEYTVTFSTGAEYDTFKQSYLFTITDKDFTKEEKDAISVLKSQVFEYDMSTASTEYAHNRTLFDLSKIDSDTAVKIKDMLGITNSRSSLKIVREGIWANRDYDNLFDDNFEITYNLNRMWNNTYSTLTNLLKDYPMNQPDTYTVYYQLKAKNRKALVNESNDSERRQYCFNVVVYRTLTVPTINDIVYDGAGVFPTISYTNGDVAFEQTYYSLTLPTQDNVNTGNKSAILTIPDVYFDLYRWADKGDTPTNRKFTKQITIEYNIVPAENATTEGLYIAGWSWNSQISKDDILWSTKFGNNKEDFTFTLVPLGGDDSHIYTIDEFGTAPAGDYTLIAECPADVVNGNWKKFTAEYRVAISVATNTWYKSPSISTWNWNQFEDFNWDDPNAVSPIEINAIPTYYSNSDKQQKGSGRFDFRIYSIDENASGNDRYQMVYFDDEEKEFHFQYAKDADGNFIMNGDNFVLPIDVAKRLASLPAGQYYLVATVYNSNNYTGLNNSEESFVKGAVPFTIGSSNNVWSYTIATTDWTYMEFELGRHISLGTAKWETQLKYAIYPTVGDKKLDIAISVLGVSLENISDFDASVRANDGKTYTYAQLVNLLDVGSYTLTVHGDAAPKNFRGGINYRALDDSRRVTVNKARNTLTSAFTVNTYTIGGNIDIPKYTARFEDGKVGYRISRGGVWIDGLAGADTQTSPIEYDNSLTYDELIKEIKKLTSAEGGRQYTIWYATKEGDNYSAVYDGLALTVYLGQNDWDGDAPSINDWTYDKVAHPFDKEEVNLIHKVDDSNITVNYYVAVLNTESGKYELGAQLSDCPINTGVYFARITIGSDDYYKGLSTDLFFRVGMADNDFKTSPSIKSGGWAYSQLKLDDITVGVPENEEENMYINYDVYRIMSSGEEERMATLSWVLGRDVNNNQTALEAFYTRLNSFGVGEYKLYVSISSSANYNEKVLAPARLTVSQAKNGFADGKEPSIVDKTTQWEWDNYDASLWKEIGVKFGEINIFIDGEAVAALSVSSYLSRLGVGEHNIRFVVDNTTNYEGLDETRSFTVIKNKNGWKDGDKDKTAFVNNWTWGKYDNDIAGGNPVWKEPAPNYGTPQASIYKGKDGVGGSLIRGNVALYSLDIIMNNLDAGDYYIIWTIVGDSNYEAISREYINFEVKVNPNEWDVSKPATMHKNDKQEISGIEFGWTWGQYGKDSGVDYFTVPVAKYGLVVAKITKYDTTWSNPEVIVDGISNHMSIANTLEKLSVGRYKIEWSAVDPNSTGNFKEIEYPNVIEFIVNRGVNAWTGEKPYIDGWQWGAFDSSLWKAPGLLSGSPNATVIKLNDDGTDGDHIAEKISADFLSAVLAELEVGNYRLVWTADDNDNYEIEGENKDDLKFQVSVNVNGWVIKPAITATDSKWQWKTFTFGYWQRPSAQFHNNDIEATVYKLNDGCDFEYDALNNKYILNKDNCTVIDGITLATLDGINNLSVGKYLIRVSVPEDAHGRYLGIESVLPFTIVPNENDFISVDCYVKEYAYADFRGYWSAPTSQFGDIVASIYKMQGEDRQLIESVSTDRLNDVLSTLHVGNYQIDWTITEDANGNYLGGKSRTSAFAVKKANNYWLQKPAIESWAWGSFDASKNYPKATPLFKSQVDLPVYFKIVDSVYGEISGFDGLVNSEGYFTDISKVQDVVKNLIPATYHLLAYYPELDDYYQLDSDNDFTFEVKHAENKWVMTPDVIDWTYGSPSNLPTGSAVYGEEITYTYYKAVVDANGEPVFKNGKYEVVENSAFSGWGKDEVADAGVYIVQAYVAGTEFYSPLSTQFVLRVSTSQHNFWKTQPAIQSWVFGSDKSLPEGEAAYGNVDWTYYKAEWNEVLSKWVPTGEALSTDGENPPEEVGKYILVASVKAAEGYSALLANVFFEIYERATSESSDILVYIDIALAILASIFTIVVIIAVVRRYTRNDGINE